MTKLVNKSRLREMMALMLWYGVCVLASGAIALGSLLIVLSDAIYSPIDMWVTIALLCGTVCALLWLFKAISKLEATFDRWCKLRRRYKRQFSQMKAIEIEDFFQ